MSNHPVAIRFFGHALEAIQSAAKAAGVPMSRYIRDAALARATRTCPKCSGRGYVARRGDDE